MGGEKQSDSLILIPISELKLANIKMTELKYEKIINDSLRSIIKNDSIIINTYRTNVDKNVKDNKRLTQKNILYNKQRNIAFTIAGASILLFLLK